MFQPPGTQFARLEGTVAQGFIVTISGQRNSLASFGAET